MEENNGGTSKVIVEDSIVTGTLIDGQLLPYREVRLEYRRKYTYARTALSLAVIVGILMLAYGVEVEIMAVLVSGLLMLSAWMAFFYRASLKALN